ncbi:hypothetical protein [Flavobacterium sp.]|uniref:hypothetical protein n=1 Tax=Flavobacterium sp. TaxID=239 RepID=UPI0025BDB746|nr:hypothetical protein [Flavobacterium sp.]
MGKYSTRKSTNFEKLSNYFIEKCNVLGVELDLRKDSTFTLSTCSYEASGVWNINKDTLFLNHLKNNSSKDSIIDSAEINELKELKKKSEYYLIKDDKLIQSNETVDSESCKITLHLVK